MGVSDTQGRDRGLGQGLSFFSAVLGLGLGLG